MSLEDQEAERKLRKLGARLQQGWTNLYALPPQERERLRELAGAQWDQRAQAKQQVSEEKRQAFARLAQEQSDQEKTKTAAKQKRDHDQSHGHGHSH